MPAIISKMFFSIGPPLISLFFLMNGVGFFGVFIPIRLEMEGTSSWDVGLITSSAYIGMILGALRNDKFILRVGHIRSYIVFAFLMALVTFSQGLFYSLWYWIILRCVAGYSLSGLYIVVESWILGESSIKERGKFVALYMIILHGSCSTGQLLLNVFNMDGLSPFIMGGTLAMLSVIPLSLRKTRTPKVKKTKALTFVQLYKTSPQGTFSCGFSGLLMGSIFGLLPFYIQATFNDVSETTLIVFFLMAGGATLQYPIGLLSDIVDRKKLLIFLCFIISAVGLYAIQIQNHSVTQACILMFIFGGVSFSAYPVGVTYTCDFLRRNEIISATQGLILAYSIGAVFGPLFSSFLMTIYGKNGLFLYFIAISISLATYLTYSKKTYKPRSVENH